MPAAFVRLFLVRHAEALANPDLRYLGSRDDPLTARGQWQALQLAQAFAPLALAAVYTSPLTRAVATAQPIAEAHGLALIPDPRLVEAAMGTWEGLRRAEILARSADDAARHQQWEADPTCAPPGGESLAAVQARVVVCVRDLAERHAGAAVVLISHVGPIKALLCTAMDVPLTTGQRLFLDSATVSVIDWGGPCGAVGGTRHCAVGERASPSWLDRCAVDAPRRDRVNRAGRLSVERVWRLKMTRHQGALRSPAQARDTRAPLTTPHAQPAQSAAAPPEGGTFRVCNTAIVLGRPPHSVYPHGHGDDTFPSTVVFQVWM